LFRLILAFEEIAMTLPWFLNPWAEVRRLRAELKWRDHMRLDMAQAYRDERTSKFHLARENTRLQCENSVLAMKIGEMEEHEVYVAMKNVAADAINLLEKREAENADLRRRIAEMEK